MKAGFGPESPARQRRAKGKTPCLKDPYEILGVPKTASEAEIKKAFRTLAKTHHPDKHQGDAKAQKKFQEISGA